MQWTTLPFEMRFNVTFSIISSSRNGGGGSSSSGGSIEGVGVTMEQKVFFCQYWITSSSKREIVIYLLYMIRNGFMWNMYNYLIQNGRMDSPRSFFSLALTTWCNYNNKYHTVPHRLVPLLAGTNDAVKLLRKKLNQTIKLYWLRNF